MKWNWHQSEVVSLCWFTADLLTYIRLLVIFVFSFWISHRTRQFYHLLTLSYVILASGSIFQPTKLHYKQYWYSTSVLRKKSANNIFSGSRKLIEIGLVYEAPYRESVLCVCLCVCVKSATSETLWRSGSWVEDGERDEKEDDERGFSSERERGGRRRQKGGGAVGHCQTLFIRCIVCVDMWGGSCRDSQGY